MRVLILALVLTGCATHWRSDDPDKTQADFTKDRYECLKEIQNTTEGSGNGHGFSVHSRPSCGALFSCLNAKGYHKDSKGPFTPEERVRCNR